MSLRTITAALAAVMLVLGTVLLAARHFLAGDLAALLGSVAIFVAGMVAVAICLYNHAEDLNQREPRRGVANERAWIRQDPTIRDAVLRGMFATDLTSGLWIGLVSDQPLVTAPAYCLTQLAFKGLLGSVSLRIGPILWIRAGILLCSVLLGVALQAAVN